MNAPRLDGFHHVKIPVTDMQRSLDWYRSRLGFTEGIRFVEDGVLTGVTLEHPNGGPPLALRTDARASDGSARSTSSPSASQTRTPLTPWRHVARRSAKAVPECTVQHWDGSWRCCTTPTATRSASTPRSTTANSTKARTRFPWSFVRDAAGRLVATRRDALRYGWPSPGHSISVSDSCHRHW